MTTTQEALKMAIEAMEQSKEAWHQIGIYDAMYDNLVSKIQFCKEALEQQEQEPVAWINEDDLSDTYPYDEMFKYSEVVYGIRVFPVFALNTHPAKQLSDDDIHNIADYCFNFASEQFDEIFKFARAIEAKIRGE